jgi:hypothetical protein
VIGSEAGEWWSGYETMRSVVTTIVPELAAVDSTAEVEHVEAFSEGTVGWVVARLVMRSSTTTVPMRYTAVLHLDRGVWRIVHSHLSQGVDSEVSFGVPVSKVILSTGCNEWDRGLDVVVEGDAVQVTDDGTLQRLADEWRTKWDGSWQFEARDGAFHHEAGAALVFAVAPTKVLAFAKGTFTHTSHRF